MIISYGYAIIFYMIELLAPAGTFLKLKTAFKFGADAVYFAGKKFGLRAFAGNFEDNEIEDAVKYAHSINKKVYITVNILAHEADFDGLKDYILYLDKIGVDAVIVADIGIIKLIRDIAPNLDIHVSTQANVTNSYSAKFFASLGVKRIVLARELSIEEIKKIHTAVPEIELEAFVHGAMCISYSGRCLLSNYFTGRDSNRGTCVQACRWEYTITEKSRQGQQFPIEEDERGTYILNSKDLCMINHLKELEEAGVCSFKIEGRMKSEYYVACTVNAYRRALNGEKIDVSELEKSSHRLFTTGFYFGEKDKECFQSSMPVQTHEFMALVLQDQKDGWVKIEQRNRFKVGDSLEVLSPDNNFNKKIIVEELRNLKGEEVFDAKKVQEVLMLKTNLNLKEGDILRAEKN